MSPVKMTEPANATEESAPAGFGASSVRIRLAAALIVLAAALAYANTFSVPFIFDDIRSIVDNPSIRDLGALRSVLSPPTADGATVGGRPFLNFTLALNHALSGTSVWSYHLFNLVIHTLAGLTLLGIVRRALCGTPLAPNALPVALITALLWTLHPLQTESVTYVVQRAESLCGLLYLFTLYAFIRGAGVNAGAPESPSVSRCWFAASTIACLLGMATKEVMATAPLMVLLFDRAFLSGSFGAALRSRRGYYAGLAATWLLLGALLLTNAERGGTAGLDVGVTPWAYAWSQLLAVTNYLGLIVWPFPQMIDHGGTLAYGGTAHALFCGTLVAVLLAATGLTLVRAPRLGFVGAWFFVVLAPSSSFVPLLDTMFEHRLYLPLAAPLVLLVAGAAAVLGPRTWLWLAPVIVTAGLLTFSRNATYRSAVTLWTDNVTHQPANARARFELGNVLLEQQRAADAVEQYRQATVINPNYIEAHHNLGAALLQVGRVMDAVVSLETALRLHPLARTHLALASAYAALGRIDDAAAQYDAALRLAPRDPNALNNRANIRLQKNQPALALADYEAALRLAPDHVDAHVNAAVALLALQRGPEAVAHCETAVRLRPDYGAAHWKFGDTLLELGRLPEAIDRYREAVRLDPSLAYAHHNLGRALDQSGRLPESLVAYEQAVRLVPNWALARQNYALALERAGKLPEATAQNDAALRLQPDLTDALNQRARLRQPAPRRN